MLVLFGLTLPLICTCTSLWNQWIHIITQSSDNKTTLISAQLSLRL